MIQDLYHILPPRADRHSRSSLPHIHQTGPRAIGYVRVSTHEQGRSGLGLEAQEASIREACALQGWELAGLYRDVESGGTDAREGLQGVLGSLTTCNLFVIYDQSRLGRRFRSLALIEELEDRNVRVYLTAERRFAGTDLHTGFLGVMSVEERRKVRERTRAALAAKKARGEWVGAVPFGFRRASAGGHLEEDPAVMRVRRRAFRLRREGHSLRAISVSLGVPYSTLRRTLADDIRARKRRLAA